MKNSLLNKLFGLTVGALLVAAPFNSFAEEAEEAPEKADQGCSGDEGCNADEACSGDEGCSGKEDSGSEKKAEEAPVQGSTASES